MSSCLWLTMWLLNIIQGIKVVISMLIAYTAVNIVFKAIPDPIASRIFSSIMRGVLLLTFIYSVYPDKHIQAMMFDEGMNSAKFIDLSKESLEKISEIKTKVFVLDKK